MAAISDEKKQAIQELYERYMHDLQEILGGECDLLITTHPRHSGSECYGMSLHTNASAGQVHKMAVHAAMWAEEAAAFEDFMAQPPTKGDTVN